MGYPNFKNKHLEEPLFTPFEFIGHHYKKRPNFPKKWVIIFTKSIENYIKRKYKPKKVKKHPLSGNMYIKGKVGFFKMGGVGAPHAAMSLEELIGLGGKEFIFVGLAGGLRDFGIFVCDKAIRDEGTSLHYIPSEKYSYPDKILTKKFESFLKKKGVKFEVGSTWTIDAPYRETRAEINSYKKEGVKCVEMEASALFSVAQFRKVKIAAAFVVSDLVGTDKWDPQFDKRHVRLKLNKITDYAFECLRE